MNAGSPSASLKTGTMIDTSMAQPSPLRTRYGRETKSNQEANHLCLQNPYLAESRVTICCTMAGDLYTTVFIPDGPQRRIQVRGNGHAIAPAVRPCWCRKERAADRIFTRSQQFAPS